MGFFASKCTGQNARSLHWKQTCSNLLHPSSLLKQASKLAFALVSDLEHRESSA